MASMHLLCNERGGASPMVPPLRKGGYQLTVRREIEVVTCFGKENKLRRLMLLLGLLAATMLVASPVLAHPGGPDHGNRYQKNYYPNSYFKYCEPDGAQYYGDNRANNNFWCDTYYTEYTRVRRPSPIASWPSLLASSRAAPTHPRASAAKRLKITCPSPFCSAAVLGICP